MRQLLPWQQLCAVCFRACTRSLHTEPASFARSLALTPTLVSPALLLSELEEY
jgi:hypothetical protein